MKVFLGFDIFSISMRSSVALLLLPAFVACSEAASDDPQEPVVGEPTASQPSSPASSTSGPVATPSMTTPRPEPTQPEPGEVPDPTTTPPAPSPTHPSGAGGNSSGEEPGSAGAAGTGAEPEPSETGDGGSAGASPEPGAGGQGGAAEEPAAGGAGGANQAMAGAAGMEGAAGAEGTGGAGGASGGTVAVAVLSSTGVDPGHDDISGTATFTDDGTSVTLVLELEGCPMGSHVSHIHVNPSCDNEGNGAGNHWLPNGELLEDYSCSAEGIASYTLTVESDRWTIGSGDPDTDVLEHAFMVHAGTVIAPGDRVACGVIELE